MEQVPQAVNNLHVMRRGLTKPLNWVRSLELRYSVLEEADTSLPDCTDMLVCSGYCLILFCHQDGRLSSCSSPLSPKGPVFCKSFSLFFFFFTREADWMLGRFTSPAAYASVLF